MIDSCWGGLPQPSGVEDAVTLPAQTLAREALGFDRPIITAASGGRH